MSYIGGNTNPGNYIGNHPISGLASSLPNFRNRILNGGLQIAQRGTTGTTPNTNNYLLDRFSLSRFGGYPDNATQSQDTDSPSGHLKSLKFIRNSGHTLTGTHGSALTYAVEGNDIYHFNWGSSSAKAVTLSFWVKSNKTGNFSLILTDTNSAYDIGKLYTISNSDTWEHKKVYIEAPTSGGTFNTDNTAGFYISWGFGATDSARIAQGSTWGNSNSSGSTKSMVTGASTSLATDSGATFYITGVQLEEGTATPFEHRPYGVELSLCQRYFETNRGDGWDLQATGMNTGVYYNNNASSLNTFFSLPIQFNTVKRASPSVKIYATYSGNVDKVSTNYNTNTDADSTVTVVTKNGFSGGVGASPGGTFNVIDFNWTAESEL